MINTYVVAPNFSIAPPPRIPRPSDPPPAVNDPAPNDPSPNAPEPSVPGSSARESGGPESGATAMAPAAAHAAGEKPVDPFSGEFPLQLGDVLAHPFGPELAALNRFQRIPVSGALVERSSSMKFTTTRKQLYSGRLGLWAGLLAAVGIGAKVDVSLYWQSKSDEVLEVERLETRTFVVTDEYIEALLASPPVVKQLNKFPNSDLYVVSGIKVAEGFKMNANIASKMGATAGAGDTSETLSAKALELVAKRSSKVSVEDASDFVLAVQLRYIKFKARKPTGPPQMSMTRVTLWDGTQVQSNLKIEYQGITDDLSADKDVFANDIVEEQGKRDDESGQGKGDKSELAVVPELEKY